jgi:hypothetical protein
MESIEDNRKIKEFRDLLKNIKKTTLNKITYSTQSTGALTKVEQRLKQFYTLLKPIVYYGKPIDTIPIEAIRELFYDTLTYPRSSYYQNQLEYYLYSDFIDYPFTIYEDDIQTHNDVEHNGEPHIIENNISLSDSYE